jgi:hypothetical protein
MTSASDPPAPVAETPGACAIAVPGAASVRCVASAAPVTWTISDDGPSSSQSGPAAHPADATTGSESVPAGTLDPPPTVRRQRQDVHHKTALAMVR